ncbi:hypothetical protein [Paracnuella aquatica]|uniref:hypothetical protein n=1 Tax=Paracnuella aquatica TaxID=2268757 RepID=UPI000DF00E93|nr:hypothetical protein [Paracnuella aquatica]RPD48282.1 hypothetical protein DRJ53_11090 [Paracnuella aquatica]
MTYLLWTICNIALLLFFIYVCFRATTVIREKIGGLAALVFVIGLLSFANRNKDLDSTLVPNQQYPNSFVQQTNRDVLPKSEASAQVVIADYVGTDLHMSVGFSRTGTQQAMAATRVYFSFEGMVGGHQWQPREVSFNRNAENGTINYAGNGLLKWCILSIPVYTQNKSFTGVINLQ